MAGGGVLDARKGREVMRTQREFFAALAKCRNGWRVNSDGGIRRGDGRGGYCPITAVARELTGEKWSISLPSAAANSIGLPSNLAGRIVGAADWRSGEPRLRKRILAALGLEED